MERNLTTGNVLGTVISFSLPFLLSYFLQTLYGLADLFIVGRFNAVDSITAVSIGSQIMHMITVMIVGLAMGSTVMIARSVGAGRKKDVSLYIGNTVTLFMALSVVLMVILLILVKPITAVMSTPEEAVPGTVRYLTICFIGIPFITAYNIISSIFRGLGDSRTPMYFVAVACAANILLDLVFIGALGMGPAGAALGTVLSQTLSVAIALIVIKKRRTGISLKKKMLRPVRSAMAPLIKIGLPVSLQDGAIQIGFLVITMIANMRGLDDAAAVGIVEKIIGILFLVPSSMLASVSALSAQNIGAGKPERARKTLYCGISICVIFGAFWCVLMQFAAGSFVGLFTDSAAVITHGAEYMHGYVIDCMIAGIHFCFSGYFVADGRSGISFAHNVISICAARVPLAYLASKTFPGTLFPMGLATTLGSSLSAVICIIVFIVTERRKKTQAV